MTDFRYSQSEFNTLLSQFQSAIDRDEYTEKIDYDTWRKLKKLAGPIVIEYESPFVQIKNCFIRMDGTEARHIVYSSKVYDWGFGRFFYNYVVKGKNRIILNNTTSTTSALNSKADYMGISDVTYDTGLTDKTVCDDKEYAYYDADSASIAKIAEPNRTNTIELTGISSLDHFGCHDTNGVWNPVASARDVDDKIEELRRELEKKIDKTEKTECIKENDAMMKGFNFDFGVCDSTVRMSMYGLAIKNMADEWVSYNPTTKEIVNVDVFNIPDGGKYMYKMPVAINNVAVGDVVIHNRTPMFVTVINENGTFEAVDVRAGESKVIIPTRNMFGFNFMTKVVNLFNSFTAAPSQDNPFGNMLPFLMMNGEDSVDNDAMLMFMMMQGQNGSPNMFSNPMMMYFLMKDKDKNENKDMDPMAWMCLSMAMGAVPAFMTGNYPKAIVTPETQA